MTTVRLLVSQAASGSANMALDQAVLHQVSRGESPLTLRLYAWDPACLSLGHAQPSAVVDPEAVRARGWDVVRRPTGGRALLHADEITYAVIAPERDPAVAGGVLSAYQNLRRGLVAGVRRLGVEPDAESDGKEVESDRANPVCFEAPSAYEITVGRKKLVGSAQLRRRGAVLQHGALPLYGDLARVVRALRYPSEAARRAAAGRLLARATTLEAALGRRVTWDEAASALAEGFASGLGWALSLGSPTPQELAEAGRLRAGADPANLLVSQSAGAD